MRKAIGIALALLLIPVLATAQSGTQPGTKKKRPLPPEFGRVIIDTPHADQKYPTVQFDHWLHRAKFTCRVCHVDVGFAMKANGTGIRKEDIMTGYYCGACHNGSMRHDDRTVFAACADTATEQELESRCLRCHSGGVKKWQKYDFFKFVVDLPKERFGNGISWQEAEVTGKIKPLDYVEGLSFKRRALEIPKDIDIDAKVEGMNEIIFSHKKHAVWNGCEGCHPEIFSGIKQGLTKFTMMENFEGKFCGQCHLNVAFPMIDCQRCHTKPVQ